MEVGVLEGLVWRTPVLPSRCGKAWLQEAHAAANDAVAIPIAGFEVFRLNTLKASTHRDRWWYVFGTPETRYTLAYPTLHEKVWARASVEVIISNSRL